MDKVALFVLMPTLIIIIGLALILSLRDDAKKRRIAAEDKRQKQSVLFWKQIRGEIGAGEYRRGLSDLEDGKNA